MAYCMAEVNHESSALSHNVSLCWVVSRVVRVCPAVPRRLYSGGAVHALLLRLLVMCLSSLTAIMMLELCKGRLPVGWCGDPLTFVR